MPHLSSTISPTTSKTLLSPPAPSSDVATTTANYITATPPPTSSAIFNSTNNINNVSIQPLPPLQSLQSLNLSAINGEEISTIFVVGFPEDMLEREFQNMFIFSPGFEAATLKIPNNKDQEDELMLNNSNGNGNNALISNDNSDGTSNTGGIIDGNETNSTNKSTYNNNGMRKQIIGFAKFRTRMEALEARDIISGRKVDAEKGSVLKAEMAKKNLHTKRGLSLEPLQQHQVLLGFPTQALSPPINQPSYTNVPQQQQQLMSQQTPPPSSTSLTSPITSSALVSSTAPPASSSSSLSLSTTATATTTATRFNNTSANAINHAAYEAFYSVPSSDNFDLFTSVTSPTTGDYLYPDLFSPTLATGSSSAFKDSILFSPGSNRAPSSSSSFDLRTSSVGDIFNSTSSSSSSSTTHQHSSTSRFPLSSSLSSSSTTTAAIRGSGFNANAHRLSSKHIFDMEKDTNYLSKSTPTNHFFPLHDSVIHPTSLASTASSSSSSSSSFSAHHHPLYSQSSTNTFNPGTITVNNINGLSSVMEETGDGSAPTTPPESLDMENKDGYDFLPWQSHQQQQQQRASFANKDPVAELHYRVNGLSINTNTTNNLMKGISNINNNDAMNKLTSPATTTITNNNNNNNNNTFAPPTAPILMNNTITATNDNNSNSNNNGNGGFLRNYNGNGVIIGSTNPADQNPPCNTLYVGNLPPNTNEDELKQMFSKCLGYKRLSFRHKANGPMCFVEFVDVMCATQALQDLYGNPLSNSVKGGIRLSFSKNPLGVRQQQQPPMGGPNNTPFITTSTTTTPPPSTVTSNMNFGFMNGGLTPMNYTRRGSTVFDLQLS